ncbi:hypothetical protein [Streptomyces sp. URMC 123]|uniref:hypothetical protein n=1 Tax=Streptomyces sp. URMC 123 TaxID=3423403 RepID=UPI003F19EC42
MVSAPSAHGAPRRRLPPAALSRLLGFALLLFGLVSAHGLTAESTAAHSVTGRATAASAVAHALALGPGEGLPAPQDRLSPRCDTPTADGLDTVAPCPRGDRAPAPYGTGPHHDPPHDGHEAHHAAPDCLAAQPEPGMDLPAPATTPLTVPRPADGRTGAATVRADGRSSAAAPASAVLRI